MHANRFAALVATLIIGALAGCASGEATGSADGAVGQPDAEEETIRYVALGDSYTIGTGVAAADRWPNQLVDRIGDGTLELVANLGVNGYTSADLIRTQLPELDRLDPEFVTLLIGVNDVVQGVPAATYEANVAAILDDLRARLPADRVLCIATPDYTLTPQGSAFGNPDQQRAGIVENNETLRAACELRGVRFVAEPFEVSQGVAQDSSLVAGDGLHPSGEQYALWVDAIAPITQELIGG